MPCNGRVPAGYNALVTTAWNWSGSQVGLGALYFGWTYCSDNSNEPLIFWCQDVKDHSPYVSKCGKSEPTKFLPSIQERRGIGRHLSVRGWAKLTLILEKEPQNTRRRLLYWSSLCKQRRGGAHARTDVYPASPWPNIDTEKNASLCWQGEIEHQWRSKDFYSSKQKENEREKGSNIPRTARESLKAKWQAKLESVVRTLMQVSKQYADDRQSMRSEHSEFPIFHYILYKNL